MIQFIKRLFGKKKPALNPPTPPPTYRSPVPPSFRDTPYSSGSTSDYRRSNSYGSSSPAQDSSNDLLNPMNPLSPMSPLNPISPMYHDNSSSNSGGASDYGHSNHSPNESHHHTPDFGSSSFDSSSSHSSSDSSSYDSGSSFDSSSSDSSSW